MNQHIKYIMKKTYLYSIASLFVLAILAISAFNYQQADNRGYDIGESVSDFRLKNVDGRMVSLSDNRSAKGYIVIFTCNHCPFSKAYEGRISELNNKFASRGYPVIAINPNDPNAYEEDSFANMKLAAQSKGFSFPYVQDETQDIAKAFGASRTPSAFVLKKEGDRFTVQYIGAIDDNTQDANGVAKKYVEDAVNSLLSNRPVVVNTTKSVGCAIKWKRL
jgi:peroxiredoxin